MSDLAANAAEALTPLAEQREPLLIAHDGETEAVLQAAAPFDEARRRWRCS